MGFTDSSLFTGTIDFQDIPQGQESFWTQQISSITVQGNSVTLTPGSASFAAIDTGTTLIGGPSSVIAEIFAQIPGSAQGTGNLEGYFTYPCETQVQVTMSFGGQTWPISSSDFFLMQVSLTECVGAFFQLDVQGDGTPPWIVGDTFLKNVYSVFRFDPPAVGFATLSSTANALSGDINAPVPTPTLGSVQAQVTATSGGGTTRTVSGAAPRLDWRTAQNVFAATIVAAVATAVL